jgi:hypothetical protein
MNVSKKIFAAIALLAANFAHATLIDKGSQTYDSTTGYMWYDLTATAGISYNDMLNNFAQKSSLYYGYRYATKDDLNTLASHVSNGPSLAELLVLFGQTGSNCCARSDGFYDDQTANGTVGQAYVIPYSSWIVNPNVVNFIGDFRGANDVNWAGTGNLVGSWILKAEAPASVPEPSSIALFAGAALAAAALRRRVK